jgi:hypothetical protein
MSKRLYMVFSKPPDDVSEEEYDRWYHHHVRENVVVPGFLGGQRFAVNQVIAGSRVAPGRFESDNGSADSSPFTHLAMYEYEGTIDELRAALFERIDSGQTVLPPWFDRIRFMTWDCEAIDDHVDPGRDGLRLDPAHRAS